MNIDNIIEKSKSLSDLARYIFGKENYTNREKCKQILSEHGIEWKSWCEGNKKKEKKYCLYCGKELSGRRRKKFCNHSCAASYNNKGITRNGIHRDQYCLYCGKKIKYPHKFCNLNCSARYKYEQWVVRWKNGEENGLSGKYGLSDRVRQYLMEKYQCKCQKCGWGEKSPYTQLIPLHVHHIDGDCTNNKEENLQLLCPNCHSLTENFGNLNKNATRKDNRKRW